MKKPLPYPPPWMDMPALCQHISTSPDTVDKWVARGRLPPPVKVEGKQMWEWEQVCDWLKNGGPSSDSLTDRVRNGTRREKADARAGH